MADIFLGSADGPAGVNKLVVIKRLHEGLGRDPAYVAMFLDEARLSARMNHPNIVHTFEAERVGREYIIVMEYLDGQPLRRLIKALHDQGQQCAPEFAAHLLGEALIGLHYVHEMVDYDGTSLGIVHRDISPQNLFVTYDGRVKVLDFGIAKGTLNATDTQDGVVKGKFAYMAPEQASAAPVDRRADVFSSGVVLWELLTGRRLFRGETASTLVQILTAPIPAPSSVVPGVPAELDRIVLKALARSADDRFSSALEMSEALSELTRKSERKVRHQDIARVMQALFGDAREEMSKRILEYMSRRTTESVLLLEGGGDPTSQIPQSVVSFASTLAKGARSRGLAVFGALLLLGAVGARFAFPWLLVHRPVRANVPAPTAKVAEAVESSFHLSLTSEPVEAQVEWDGRVVGQTPLLIDLDPGPQTFVLSLAGYFNATVVVSVTPGMAGRTESRTAVMAARDAQPHSPADVTRFPTVHPTIERPRLGAPQDLPNPSTAIATLTSDGEAAAPAEKLETVADSQAHPPVAFVGPSAAAAQPPAVTVALAPLTTGTPVSAVLPFGPDMTRPNLISGEPLVFPREAMLAHVSGAIIARCTITTEGALRACRIIKGLPFLDQAMLDSLATRRYTPVLAQGRPVSVQYVFNLKVASPS